MSILEIQTSTPGVSPDYEAVSANGDAFPNDASVFLFMDLPSVRRLIVESPHAALPDYEQDFGPGIAMSPRFDPLRWNDPATGRVIFRFDDPAGVSVAAVRADVESFEDGIGIAGSLI